ncbi:MAG: DNA methyltransferase, partial [Desulfatibacillaceae bacterium]|nr:DNA methyltransferase [Desulfatibacillaceae bacterium]
WHWGHESEEAYHELVTQGQKKLADLMHAMRSFLGTNDMMAYLTMMAIRLVEMRRVLKSTGSIYLHCDPKASHYLKLFLDAIFGYKNFLNEIVWCYRQGGRGNRVFPRKHDIIFWYSKGVNYYFDPDNIRIPYHGTGGYVSTGRNIVGGKEYWLNPKGKIPEDWWDIPALTPTDKERLGYPTQKPESLLERIIYSSSKEGDVVMDPFCGCGTTLSVSERLNRKWIGIDITHLAITLMKHRLEDTFGFEMAPYDVMGDPKDISGAKALAEHDRYQFEWWALGKVSARPAQDKKKGADSGVDGYLYFLDDNSGQPKKIIIQVKSGNVKRGDIATLKGDMEREKAVIGAFLTLSEPTRPMKEEAAAAGIYTSKHFLRKRYPKLQILTIEDILDGKQIEFPRVAAEITFKKAVRKRKKKEEQDQIEF